MRDFLGIQNNVKVCGSACVSQPVCRRGSACG